MEQVKSPFFLGYPNQVGRIHRKGYGHIQYMYTCICKKIRIDLICSYSRINIPIVYIEDIITGVNIEGMGLSIYIVRAGW